MADQSASNGSWPDPVEWSQQLASIAERSQAIVKDFLLKHPTRGTLGHGDPFNVGSAFLEMTSKMITNPAVMVQAQMTALNNFKKHDPAAPMLR